MDGMCGAHGGYMAAGCAQHSLGLRARLFKV